MRLAEMSSNTTVILWCLLWFMHHFGVRLILLCITGSGLHKVLEMVGAKSTIKLKARSQKGLARSLSIAAYMVPVTA